MKIAVISDIHANFIALQAVAAEVDRWKPDFVIVAGDIVNRGPRPLECLEYVQQKAFENNWLLVRGNHEDYVIDQSKHDIPITGAFAEVHRPSLWTSYLLGSKVKQLQQLPFQQSLHDPLGSKVICVHASMAGIRDGIYPETPDWQMQEKIAPHKFSTTAGNFSAFIAGHTHRPFVRILNGTTVVNAGSVGLPFDGDTRASYAQLAFSQGQWQAKIVRVRYDINLAGEDFFRYGYYDGGGPLVKLVKIELRHACSMLYSWANRYQEDVLQGNLSMEESVNRTINEWRGLEHE
jgi:predicted phosphodiesterase